MPETHPWNSRSLPMPSLDSHWPKPWDCFVSWFVSFYCLHCKRSRFPVQFLCFTLFWSNLCLQLLLTEKRILHCSSYWIYEVIGFVLDVSNDIFDVFIGAGIGSVFGSLIIGYARNPSLKQQLFSYAILGFALSEAMGLFCLMMAFLLLFAF